MSIHLSRLRKHLIKFKSKILKFILNFRAYEYLSNSEKRKKYDTIFSSGFDG